MKFLFKKKKRSYEGLSAHKKQNGFTDIKSKSNYPNLRSKSINVSNCPTEGFGRGVGWVWEIFFGRATYLT